MKQTPLKTEKALFSKLIFQFINVYNDIKHLSFDTVLIFWRILGNIKKVLSKYSTHKREIELKKVEIY